MANLQILRLVTGEEILGKIISDDDKEIEVENPVRIVVMPSKTDPAAPSVGFAPYLQWTEEKVLTFSHFHVINMVKPINEFVNQYNGMFGGLVVPNSKLIVP
jgi:hypothetical protein